MAHTGVLRALVTGATGGIGRATAFALLDSARARGRRSTAWSPSSRTAEPP
jgi:NAD(P)-dependent dehydrogenase (short-subunit alcohol dehydrogenase family)